MDCTVIIPAYRPPKSLPAFVSQLIVHGFEDILLVDDGSGAAYRDIFEQCGAYGATILRHEENLGKGNALKTAFSHCLTKKGKKYVITADCDGQHQIDDIEKLFYTITTGKYDMLLGARNFDSSTPLRSRIGNKAASRLFRRIYHLDIADTQTGLRGFSSEILPQLLSVPGSRYEYEANALIYATHHRLSMASVTICGIYIDANRSSHYRPLRDSLRITAAIAAGSCRRI